MKNLEQIKEEVREYLGIYNEDKINDYVNEVAKRYATEYAREALRLASENAIVECDGDEFSHSYIVHKQSILSENNLPKHR